MIIIGVWHAFTLNYLVFGILQAIFLSVTVLILTARSRRKRAAGRTNQVHSETWLWRYAVPFLGAALTFVLVSFAMIFFHSATWGQAMSVLAQVCGVGRSGPIGWSGIPPYLATPTWICMAVALYAGAGAPGARRLTHSAENIAPRWLQYGVCLSLLMVLSTAGSGRFIYGQF
jgi:hypothetical protein